MELSGAGFTFTHLNIRKRVDMGAEQDAKSDSERLDTPQLPPDRRGIQPKKTKQRREAAAAPSGIAAEAVSAHSREEDVAQTVQLICGKWGIRILSQLARGVMRPGKLQRAIPGISRKMVTDTLHQLESYGLIVRLDLSDRVLYVQYRLRDEMQGALLARLDALAEFGAVSRTLQTSGHSARTMPNISPL